MSEVKEELVVGISDDPEVGTGVQIQMRISNGVVSANMTPSFAREIARRICMIADALDPPAMRTSRRM
jgi:hypothetical protein